MYRITLQNHIFSSIIKLSETILTTRYGTVIELLGSNAKGGWNHVRDYFFSCIYRII